MPALTIKGIPDDLYKVLKTTAKQHHRSINSEVIVCLKQALTSIPLSPAEQLQKIQQLRAKIPKGKIGLKAIHQAKQQGRS